MIHFLLYGLIWIPCTIFILFIALSKSQKKQCNENSRTRVYIVMDCCVSRSFFPSPLLLSPAHGRDTANLSLLWHWISENVWECGLTDARRGMWTLWNYLEANWPDVQIAGSHVASSESNVCWQSDRSDSCSMWCQWITGPALISGWVWAPILGATRNKKPSRGSSVTTPGRSVFWQSDICPCIFHLFLSCAGTFNTVGSLWYRLSSPLYLS